MRHLQIFENFSPKKTIVIFGLPGSGKSTLANEIIGKNPEMNYVVYDDFEWTKALRRIGTENQIVSDGCSNIYGTEDFRSKFENAASGRGVDLEFIYFENDPESVIKNTERRKTSSRILPHQKILSPGEVYSFARRYRIPPGEPARPVWKDPSA